MTIQKRGEALESITAAAGVSPDGVPWLRLLIPYLLAMSLSVFFLNAVYWDDWELFNTDDSVILEIFRQAGVIGNWVGYLHVAMLKIGPPLYRITVLVFGYLCGVLLWKLLGTIKGLVDEEKFWIAALFLVLPLNPARFALINALTFLCLFSFFLAWYVFVARRGMIFRGISLALFLFSFNLNSLLVFYFLPLAHSVWLYAEPRWESVLRWCRKNALFICAPVFFFWFQKHFFVPYGMSENYNTISFGLIERVLLPLPVMAIVFYGVNRWMGGWKTNRWMLFVFVGAFATWLAIFPYEAVGKSPSFNDWASRFQVLMPLGVALLLTGIGLLLGNLRRFCGMAMIVSIACCIYFMGALTVDWWKQQEVIKLLAQSPEVKSARTIVFVDEAKEFNAFGRKYRFYEYNGWLRLAFGEETRFAVNDFELEGEAPKHLPDSFRKYATTRLAAGDYIWSAPDLMVTIRFSGDITNLIFGNAFKIETRKLS